MAKRIRKKKGKMGRKSDSFKRDNREMTLSLCMIVKNEAGNIERCIAPIAPVLDEVIVVDTGSTDNTKEIAERLGAKVFDFLWRDDFSSARNESVRHASGDYIIWLDADDRVNPDEVKKIKQLKMMLPREKNRAFNVVVKSESFDGSTLFHQLRIFPNINEAVFEGRVHEQIFQNLKRAGIELVQTDIIVRHTGYCDASTVLMKAERNLDIILEELKRSPDNLMFHFNAARSLAGMNQQQKAIEHMRKVMDNRKIREETPQIYLEAGILMGRYYLEMGEAGLAESILRDLSHQFSEHGLLYSYLGESLFVEEKYHEAIKMLKRATEYPLEVNFFPLNLDEIRFHQHFLLGRAYGEIGRDDPAGKMFLKSLDFHTKEHMSFQELGVLGLKNCQYEDAAQYFEEAVEKGGDSDKNYANLGLAYWKMNRSDKAKTCFLKALEMNPERLEALTNLGHIYMSAKDYEKAMGCFVKAKAITPDLPDIRLALSSIYFEFREIELMVAECDNLLNVLGLPRDIMVNGFEDLAHFYCIIGNNLAGQGHRDFSLMAYQLSLKIFPTAEALQKIVTEATAPGLFAASLEEIREILAQHKDNHSMLESVGKALEEIQFNTKVPSTSFR